MIKVGIADDHKLFREGIRFLLQNMEGVELVLEASNGKELVDMPELSELDVLLLDLDMPEMDGLSTMKMIKPQHPGLGIIILTMHSDLKMISHLMELGANGYLLKDTSPDEFKEAIESVMQNGNYFNQRVSQAILTSLKGNDKKKVALNGNETITQREMEVLELICQEFTAKEIAEKLSISYRTVEGHRNNLIDKFGVKNTAGLIVKAIKEGLVKV